MRTSSRGLIRLLSHPLPLALCLLLPCVARAEPPLESDDAERARLEEELRKELGEATEAAPAAPTESNVSRVLKGLMPDLSFILDVAGAYYSSDPLAGGAHDPAGTGFTLQQLELHATSSVDHIFAVDVNLVFSQFGVELEEAYARTLGLPVGLQVRVGQLLTRFGRLNGTHPHAWSFLDQPLVNGKFFGAEGSRGLGGELSWLVPVPWYLELAGAMSEAGGECCARSFYGADDPGVEGIGDFVYTTTIKQFFEFDQDWSLSLGLSAQFGPNPTGHDNRTEIYGGDLYLRYRPVESTHRLAVSLTAEGMFRTRQVPGGVVQDAGVYTQLVANLTPEWEVGGRYEYVSAVAEDPLDPGQDPGRQRVSLELTYYPSHFSRVRLQGNWDQPQWSDAKPVWAGILGLEFLIGAHGGHAF